MDKLSMSLDEIIKQNRKQTRQDKFPSNRGQNNKPQFKFQKPKASTSAPKSQMSRNQKFNRPGQKFVNNSNKNNKQQNLGILSKSKIIKKNRPTKSVVIGAIGNQGRNRQQQLNKFRLQRRRNNQNVNNSQLIGKLKSKSAPAQTARPVAFKRPRSILGRFSRGKLATAGSIAKKLKPKQSIGALKTKANLKRRGTTTNTTKSSLNSKVRFNAALAQRKLKVLQQPQRKLLQNRNGTQQTARKNLIRAKRLLSTRKGPLPQTKKFAQSSMKSTTRQSKFVVKKPVVKLTSQLNTNMLRINIKNNQMGMKKAAQQQIKSTKPIIKRNWKSNQTATSRKVSY
jgi:hypothetical protein